MSKNSKTVTDTSTASELTVERPNLWSLVLHDDDFTPIEFVIDVLERHAGLPTEVATAVTYAVHNGGFAKVGEFTQEIAAAKAEAISKEAASEGHPLLVEIAPSHAPGHAPRRPGP